MPRSSGVTPVNEFKAARLCSTSTSKSFLARSPESPRLYIETWIAESWPLLPGAAVVDGDPNGDVAVSCGLSVEKRAISSATGRRPSRSLFELARAASCAFEVHRNPNACASGKLSGVVCHREAEVSQLSSGTGEGARLADGAGSEGEGDGDG